MRKRFLSLVLAVIMVLALCPVALAEDFAGVSAPSKNINDPTSYNGFWESNIRPYLYANEKGGLTRVEYFGLDEVVIEEFNSNFEFQYGSRKVIKMDADMYCNS